MLPHRRHLPRHSTRRKSKKTRKSIERTHESAPGPPVASPLACYRRFTDCRHDRSSLFLLKSRYRGWADQPKELTTQSSTLTGFKPVLTHVSLYLFAMLTVAFGNFGFALLPAVGR